MGFAWQASAAVLKRADITYRIQITELMAPLPTGERWVARPIDVVRHLPSGRPEPMAMPLRECWGNDPNAADAQARAAIEEWLDTIVG